MAAKKRTPDAARVEKFLDDLRSQMPTNPIKPSAGEQLLVTASALLVQAVLFGTALGVGLRIVRFLAGF